MTTHNPYSDKGGGVPLAAYTAAHHDQARNIRMPVSPSRKKLNTKLPPECSQTASPTTHKLRRPSAQELTQSENVHLPAAKTLTRLLSGQGAPSLLNWTDTAWLIKVKTAAAGASANDDSTPTETASITSASKGPSYLSLYPSDYDDLPCEDQERIRIQIGEKLRRELFAAERARKPKRSNADDGLDERPVARPRHSYRGQPLPTPPATGPSSTVSRPPQYMASSPSSRGSHSVRNPILQKSDPLATSSQTPETKPSEERSITLNPDRLTLVQTIIHARSQEPAGDHEKTVPNESLKGQKKASSMPSSLSTCHTGRNLAPLGRNRKRNAPDDGNDGNPRPTKRRNTSSAPDSLSQHQLTTPPITPTNYTSTTTAHAASTPQPQGTKARPSRPKKAANPPPRPRTATHSPTQPQAQAPAVSPLPQVATSTWLSDWYARKGDTKRTRSQITISEMDLTQLRMKAERADMVRKICNRVRRREKEDKGEGRWDVEKFGAVVGLIEGVRDQGRIRGGGWWRGSGE